MKNWMSEHDLDHVDPNVLGERQVDSIVEQLSSEFHLPENEARDFWFSQWSGTDDPAHDDQGRSVGGESDPGFHDEKGNLLGFEDDQGGDEGYNPGGNRALEHDLDDAEEYEDPMASPESLDPEHKAIVKSLGLLPGPMPAVGWGQQRPISEE